MDNNQMGPADKVRHNFRQGVQKFIASISSQHPHINAEAIVDFSIVCALAYRPGDGMGIDEVAQIIREELERWRKL